MCLSSTEDPLIFASSRADSCQHVSRFFLGHLVVQLLLLHVLCCNVSGLLYAF